MNTLPAVRPIRQRQKPQRFARLVREAEGDFLHLRTVHVRKPDVIDLYRVEAFLSEIGGKGLQLSKPDGTVYHVNLNGKASTCDCLGHEAHGHCKHVEALLALESVQPSACALEEPLSSKDKPFAGCHRCGGSGYLKDQHRNTVCKCGCWGF